MGELCPRIIKCPISLVITEGYLQNFYELFSQLTNTELRKQVLKYVTPLLG